MFHIIQKNNQTVLQEVTFNGAKIDWMSDSQFEVETAQEFITKARGDVLMCGLGLGFLISHIIDNIDHLTIIEKEQEVINLWTNPNPEKINIIKGDAFDGVEGQFDIIYFDIWANYFQDKTNDLYRLALKYQDSLKEGGETLWWGNREE